MARVLLGSLLLLTSCASAPPPPPLQEEAARRDYWREQVQGIFACRSHAAIDSFLDGIRRLPPRRPRSLGGGSYQIGNQPKVDTDLFALDETFDLYLVWNGKDQEQGIRSVEVVGFVDLRPKIKPEYFDALQALHRCPSARSYWSFDPVLVVRAVNAFLALGTEAGPALRSYRDLARGLSFGEARKYSIDECRIFPVIQLLGTRPSPFLLGNGGVANPGSGTWPYFPLALERDIPFMVVSGYTLLGQPEDVIGRLGPPLALRSERLVPGGNPVEVAQMLTTSPRWEALLSAESAGIPKQDARGAARLKWLVRSQALEALAPVYHRPDEYVPKNCCEDPSEASWRQMAEEVRALGIRWDRERQDFVRSR
jgi:hypothetical protein